MKNIEKIAPKIKIKITFLVNLGNFILQKLEIIFWKI